MKTARVEYVGFKDAGPNRNYSLLVTSADGNAHTFTVAIPHEAFTSKRLRYQDGAEICFLKMQRALLAAEGVMPDPRQVVTNEDLMAYTTAHAPKPPQRRAPPASKTTPLS